MATAQNIDFRSSGLQSPQVAYKLAKKEDVQKIVSIGPAASRKNGKAMLTSSAPQLNPSKTASTASSAPVNPVNPTSQAAGQTFLSLLAIYMASVILAQVDLTKNQASIVQAQTTSQNSLVEVAQAQAQQAVQQYQAYEQELEEQSHENVFQKVFSYVVAAVCCVAAAFTGGMTAFLAAGIITAFTLSGGEQALSNAIGGPSWAVALGTAIVGTIATCGVAGVCSAAASSATATAVAGAETVAAATAESAVEDAVEDEVEEIEEEVSAQVNGAANKSAENAEKSFLSKAFDASFNKAALLSNGGQFFTMLNPLGELLTMAFKKMGLSEEYAEILGQILGTVLTVGAFAGTEFYFAKSGTLSVGEDPLTNFLKTNLSEKNLFRLQTGLGLARTSFQTTASVYGIQGALTSMKMAGLNEEIGNTQQAMATYNGLISSSQALSDEKSFSNLMNTYAQITSSFDALIAPGRKAAEILG